MLLFGTTPSHSRVPVKPEVPSENFLCIRTRVTCRAGFKHRFLGTLGEMVVQLVQNRAQVPAFEQVSLLHSLLPTYHFDANDMLGGTQPSTNFPPDTFQLVPACLSGEVGRP